MLPFWLLVLGYVGLGASHFVRERSAYRAAPCPSSTRVRTGAAGPQPFRPVLRAFQAVPASRMLCDNLMTLGQEHERGRRYSRRWSLRHIQRIAPHFEGLDERLERLRQLESTPAMDPHGECLDPVRAISSGACRNPCSGRLRAGAGAGTRRHGRGVSRQGRQDRPQVAIKTLACQTSSTARR